MRPAETTHADEIVRHDRLIALVARRPATRKLQSALDAVGALWRSPDHHTMCLSGRVHWRVQPSLQAVEAVAAHHRDPRADIRRAVFVALEHGAPHGRAAIAALAAGLSDDDVLVRVHAARATAALQVGADLVSALVPRLGDPVWTVRWHAALALAPTERRADAAAALLASEPSPTPAVFDGDEWDACARAFEDVSAIAERLRLRSRD